MTSDSNCRVCSMLGINDFLHLPHPYAHFILSSVGTQRESQFTSTKAVDVNMAGLVEKLTAEGDGESAGRKHLMPLNFPSQP